MIKDLNAVFASMGINIDINDHTSPLVIFCYCIILLTLLAMLCVVNILIYFGTIYISDKPVVLNKLPKHWLFVKFFNYYVKTRKGFLIFEIGFCFFNLGGIIWLCGRIIYGIS